MGKSFVKAVFFFIALFASFYFGVSLVDSAEESRAYFKIKTPEVPSSVSSFISHEFPDRVFSIRAPRVVIDILKNNPNFEFRGEASIWNISPHQSSSATCAPANSIPWGVAKVNGGSGGAGIKVAVLDTGVNKDHPDLKTNIVDCRDAQTPSLRARCPDRNGHGTHVSGTVAANGKIKGVAPDAKIMAIKVCSDAGWCWSDDVARGIIYASDNGAQVINLSLSGSSIAADEKAAIDYADSKGVLVVAASGNDGPSDNSIDYPAAYYKVVSVGATDSTDQIASWSSRGNNYSSLAYTVEERDIEFAAPGVSVESTARNGCYATYSGTSMGTPHVSGLAAKVWQGSSGTTRSYIQDRARNNYSDIGRLGDDPDAGFGLPTAP